jgi:glycerol uptake facilitator-like aquaporin
VGFGDTSDATFTAFDYFFWIPWLMPHVGAVLGAGVYYLFIEMHHPELNK